MAEGSASSPFHPPVFQAVILQGRRERRGRSFDGELYNKCNASNGLWAGSRRSGASSAATI